MINERKSSREAGRLLQVREVPMRPTTGGIFFERNLRTKIISSNEEKF